MKLSQIIRAPKRSIKIGKWGTGKIRQSAFPMPKAPSKAYKYGPSYRWCVVIFFVDDKECRLLVLFNHLRLQFRATLGVMESNGLRILCDHEYHPTEPWHCHFSMEDSINVPTGVRRIYMRRFPKRGGIDDASFPASETEALRKAIKFYRVEEPGMLL